MSTKHEWFTPRPWVFGNAKDGERLILGGPGRKYVATVVIHQIPRHMGRDEEPEREANAALIADAPRLYAENQRLREALCSIRAVAETHGPMTTDTVPGILAIAVAALTEPDA